MIHCVDGSWWAGVVIFFSFLHSQDTYHAQSNGGNLCAFLSTNMKHIGETLTLVFVYIYPGEKTAVSRARHAAPTRLRETVRFHANLR